MIEALTIDRLTFSRASARTHPVTGAEISTGVPITETYTDIVPVSIAAVSGTDGYTYLGQLSDGRYVYRKDLSSELYTTTTGEPPFTLYQSFYSTLITPAGSFLQPGTEPSVISRRAAASLGTSTNVMTMTAGAPAWLTPSGVVTIYEAGGQYSASGMSWASDGSTIWISEYSNTAAIKSGTTAWRNVWRSNDDGATWVNCYSFTPVTNSHVHALYYDPPTGALYAMIGDSPASTMGVWRSTDRGDSFTQLISTMPAPSGQAVQPVAMLRVGDVFLLGSDEAPTAATIYDPDAATFTRVPVDYEDNSLGITWSGVAYTLAVTGDFVLLGTLQGQESYYRLFAAHTSDLTKWYKVADSTAGWSRLLLRNDGVIIAKPDAGSTPDCVKITGLQYLSRTAFRTDEAVTTLTSEATPLTTGTWTLSTGAYVEAGGPDGLRSVKIGDLRRQNIALAAGDTIEFTAWLRNPTGQNNATFLTFESTFLTSGGSTIQNVQRSIPSNLLDGTTWQRWVSRATAPANTAKVNLRLLTSGFTFNVSTAYIEAAGVSVAKNGYDLGMETHDRAAESAYADRTVGASWAIFDYCWPNWDAANMSSTKSLLRVTDRDTNAYLEVQFTSAGAFRITDGNTNVAGASVRCYGPKRRGFVYGTSSRRSHFGQPDFLAYGVRVTSGTAELIVWDKLSRTARAYAAPGTFAPSHLRISFLASGTAHAPMMAYAAVADDKLVNALLRGLLDEDSVLAAETLYDDVSAIGVIGGGAVQVVAYTYDALSPTGSVSNATVIPSETIYE